MNNCRICHKTTFTRRSFIQIIGIASASLWVGMNLMGCKENLPEDEKNYYLQRKDGLLENFDDLSGIVKDLLLKEFPPSTVNQWQEEAKEEYSRIIPNIPYIGGDDNNSTRLLVLSATFIPYLKILRDNGVTTRQNGKLIYDAAKIYYHDEIIKPMRWFIGWYTLSSFKQNTTKEAAEKTQLRKYKGDWLTEFVEGEKGVFEYGMNVKECGLLKFYTEQGVQEFVPYLCITDYLLFTILGIEFRRTQTLANGGSHCDFRFVKRGSGPRGWPPESLPEWTGKFEI